MLKSMTACVILASSSFAAEPPRRLVLVGGGDTPVAAAERFVEWAGGPKANILVMAWSTNDPNGSLEDARQEFSPAPVELAVSSTALGSPAFAAQLARATGIWFAGGDQVDHMAALNSNGGAPLAAVRRRFRDGLPFGGTSAGTAVMSRIMLTGEGDFAAIGPGKAETAEGLGLLDGVILDQHFIKRGRQNRLFSVVLEHRDRLGLGIDEDTAAAIEDGRAEVFGKGAVMVVRARDGADEDLTVELVRPGQAYDLRSKTRVYGTRR